MRCSSCEPLLDAYLEAALARRRMHEIAEHLRRCSNCETLLGELRVIDALLATARVPGRIDDEFTATVVSAATTAAAPRRRRFPMFLPVVLYVAAAWVLAGVVQIQTHDISLLASQLLRSQRHGFAAIGAAARALGPATPLAAAAVTGALLIDLLLLGALLYGYRRLRPMARR